MMLTTLMALRTQLDAVQIVVDGLIADEHARRAKETDAEQPKTCSHATRQSTAVMGHPYRWRCKECGHEEDPSSTAQQTNKEG